MPVFYKMYKEITNLENFVLKKCTVTMETQKVLCLYQIFKNTVFYSEELFSWTMDQF